MQRDIRRPDQFTTVEAFIRELEAKKSAWRACYNWDRAGNYQNQARSNSFQPENRPNRYSNRNSSRYYQKPAESGSYQRFQDRAPPPPAPAAGPATDFQPRHQPRSQSECPNAYFGKADEADEEGEDAPEAYHGDFEASMAF